MHVQTGQQVRIIAAGLLPALVGQRQHKGQGRIAQRQRRGAGNRARHVGHAIMHDPVHLIDRVLMRRGARGFKAPALIDGHIHQNRTRLHRGQLRPADQFRGRSPGDQHRTDHHIGVADQIGRVSGAGIDRLELPPEDIVQIAQPGQ